MQRLVLLGTGFLLLLISATAFMGCGGGAAVAAVSINLTPTAVSLNRGATAQITAQALDAANVSVSIPTLAYHSDNPAITISNSGLICAGQWDANFITCYTCSNPDLITNKCPANSSVLLPLGRANITATATVNNVTVTSSTVVVTDHEPLDSVQVIPDSSNPSPCVSQAGTPPANTAKFTALAFSNDSAACQRITGSSSVPCQVPSSTIGSINWVVSPTTVATADAATKTATEPVVVTASIPGQGTVVGFVGATGSLVSGSTPFTTCAVASIHVQKSASDTSTSFTAPVGSTVTLVPIVKDSQGTTLDLSTSTLGLTWLSSQPALASVSLGTVNTTAPGTAEITAACLPSACNVNFTPPQPVYSDNVVTATITGTVDSTVLVTTATAPASSTSSTQIVPIDTGTNNAGTAFTLPGNVQVNSMVLAPGGNPAFLGTNCASGTTGPNGAACSGLLRFDPATSTVGTPNPNITGTALTTDGTAVVVSNPATNQLFIATATPAIAATPAINVSSLIAAAPTGATESGSTVTLATTTPHGLVVGQSVMVAGVGVAGYNGLYSVQSVPSSATFTYIDTNTGLAASGGGYVTGGVSAAIAPDRSKIYIVTGRKLYIYNPSLPLQNLTLSGAISPTSSQALDFFATGPMAYVADSGGDDVVATCNDTLQKTPPAGPVPVPGFPTHIAALPNATAMVDANSPNIDEVDASADFFATKGVCPPVITNSFSSHGFAGVSSFSAKQLIVTPDSQLAIILTSDQGVLLYNLGTKQTSVVPLSGGAQPLSGGVTPDSSTLYVGASDSKVHRVDLTKTPPTDAQSIAVSLCPSVATGCNPDFLVVRPVATVAALSSLAVTPANPTISVGATQQFTATGTFSDRTTRDMTNFVTWTTSNAVVAVVGPNTSVTPPITTPGLARALATGTTTIAASSAGLSASTTLTVK